MSRGISTEITRFRGALELFPEEQKEALGRMVQRVFLLVGELANTYLAGVDPDGFDGVEQKGEYHRLLISEWLLAEEAPDEFLRRAAMKEHLFLRVARREPKGGRRSLVFFDAGPMQLGSPRLVHLAILLALEHRAAVAGVDFNWALIQEPDTFYSATDRESILSFLKGRSPSIANAHLAEHLLLRGEAPQEGDDIWWVGDEASLCQLGLPGASISIADELLEEADSLRLTLRQGKRKREASLPLPSPSLRTRLMRDPFQKPEDVNPTQPLGEDVDYWLSFCGKYVFVRDDTKVSLINLSRSNNPKTYPLSYNGQKLVGITRHKKHVPRIHRQGGSYRLTLPNETSTLHFEQRKPEPPVGSAPLWNFYLAGRCPRRIVLRDADGTVFVGTQKGEVFYLRPILDRCTHLLWRRGHLEYIHTTPDLNLEYGTLDLEFRLHPRGRSDCARPLQVVLGYEGATQVCAFAHIEPTTPRRIETGLAKVGYKTWCVLTAYGGVNRKHIRETLKVVGLIRKESEWALLTLSEDRTELRVETDEQPFVIVRFHDPIDRCERAQSRDAILCETAGGLALVRLKGLLPGEVTYISLPQLKKEKPS